MPIFRVFLECLIEAEDEEKALNIGEHAINSTPEVTELCDSHAEPDDFESED